MTNDEWGRHPLLAIRHSSFVIRLFDDHLVFRRELAGLAGFAETVELVVHFEMVNNFVFGRRTRDVGFPAIGHPQNRSHRIGIKTDDDVWRNGSWANALLARVP